MKEHFNNQDIDKFFILLKRLDNPIKLETVHQLINNPNAKATHRVRFQFIHLKILIMTSALIIGLSAIMYWTAPNKGAVTNSSRNNQKENLEIANLENKNHEKSTGSSKVKSVFNTKSYREPDSNEAVPQSESNDVIKSDDLIADSTLFEKDLDTDCIWSVDTIIDKKSLYVYLSNEELETIGIHVVSLSGNRFYYFTQDEENSSSACWNVPCRSDTMEATPFYIEAFTDTLCTTKRWGSIFYDKVDTLIPVVAKDFNYKNRIFWFAPSDTLFKVLPDRYNELKSVFDNLKCLKKSNPEKNIVRHWDIKRNIVLDQINYLTLNKSELESIGIDIQKDSITMVDPSGTYYYRNDKNGQEVGNRKDDNLSKYPNLFPTLITDIKGLEQHRFGPEFSGNGIKNNKNNFDLLIPVLMPISEYVHNRDYSLVFWYFPTDEFIEALPDRIRTSLKSELYAINNKSQKNTSTCNYFEVCKSTIEIDDLRVFPNPANQNVTIEFSIPEAISGMISLVNISGAEIKILTPKTMFNSGLNSINANLSGVAPGMYLISIVTNAGFKTQRVIISR